MHQVTFVCIFKFTFHVVSICYFTCWFSLIVREVPFWGLIQNILEDTFTDYGMKLHETHNWNVHNNKKYPSNFAELLCQNEGKICMYLSETLQCNTALLFISTYQNNSDVHNPEPQQFPPWRVCYIIQYK